MKAAPKLGLAALLMALVVLGSTSATALAAPEWLFMGNVIGTPLPVKMFSGIYIEDMNAPGGAIAFRCMMSIEGTIGPGKAGELISMEGPNGERSTATEPKPLECTYADRGSCEEAVAPLATPLNLIWSTEILLMTVGERNVYYDLVKNSGKGNPSFELACTVLGLKFKDICEGNTGMELTNLANKEEVEGRFLPENSEITTPLNCSLGGEKEGLLENNIGLNFKSNEGTVLVSG